MSLTSINPATGVALARYRPHTRAGVATKTARAQRAFLAWRKLTPAQRARHLRALAKALRAKSPPLAALLTAEVGKPIKQSLAEIEKCAGVCDYYAQQGPRFLAPERPPGAPANAHVEFAPLGVVLAIMPWNFPFWQVFRAAAPILMGGNTLLLKHASNASGCALAIERLFATAGLPAGLLQTLLVHSDRLAPLIADPRVRGLTMTGSTAAGRKVAALAGAALLPTVFELGGSDPILVLADADIPKAAEICAFARLQNSGQSCVCAKRFIVVRSVLRAFERAFTARMAARRVGDPTDPTTDVGPLARADLRDQLHSQVRRSIRAGARVLLGGAPLPGPGNFYAPTVLTDVRPGSPAYAEELFGPVAAIIPVHDEAAAIATANDSIYGLGAAVFTRNHRRGRAVATQLESGLVFINTFTRSEFSLPFGGTKQSGHGRELGPWGLRAFVHPKTVWVG
ncbi:MAG: NAD-dependent succinate-semialdehyde dehydrogenase [Undibacterium sp.]|nr:NAD-dependent succinate-semialdehyde dehydrogenase [Opitutaceae bacterium]